MAMNDDHSRLGCGRELDEFWASIDEPPSAHEQSCADCQSARNSLYHLAAVTESMRERDKIDPDLQPGSRVKEAIMLVARAEIRRGKKTPLKRTSLGAIEISEQALVALIRFAASTLPGVRARRCEIEAEERGPALDSPTPTEVRIALKVALSSTVKIPETLALVRERVGTVVEAQTSIIMKQIDIVVEDLYDV